MPAAMPVETAFFSAFPHLRANAREERTDDGQSFTVIEVGAPLEANVEHGLVVDFSNGEVTVGFDCYHSHFESFYGGEDDAPTAAVQFVSQLLEERIAVVSWWRDDSWHGSAQVEVGDELRVPSWVSSESYNRIRVRSWRGTFNRDTLA